MKLSELANARLKAGDIISGGNRVSTRRMITNDEVYISEVESETCYYANVKIYCDFGSITPAHTLFKIAESEPITGGVLYWWQDRRLYNSRELNLSLEFLNLDLGQSITDRLDMKAYNIESNFICIETGRNARFSGYVKIGQCEVIEVFRQYAGLPPKYWFSNDRYIDTEELKSSLFSRR